MLANGLITGAAERMASGALEASGRKGALVVASPPQLAFWKRDIYWRTADRYGIASFVPGVGGNVDVTGSPTGMDDPRIDSWTKTDPAARAFLFWSRMPVAEKDGDAILLRDQRFMHPLAQERFQVRSEEQPSELKSLMRTSYAAFC